MRAKRRKKSAKMVTVRATCNTCGDVEVTIDDVRIQVCVDTSETTYSFICTICHLIVNKEANDRVLDVLSYAGARHIVWTIPHELAEVQLGPAITHDDLLDFHLAIQDDNWHEELTPHTSQSER